MQTKANKFYYILIHFNRMHFLSFNVLDSFIPAVLYTILNSFAVL